MLTYTAELKCPIEEPLKEKKARCEELIGKLGLEVCRCLISAAPLLQRLHSIAVSCASLLHTRNCACHCAPRSWLHPGVVGHCSCSNDIRLSVCDSQAPCLFTLGAAPTRCKGASCAWCWF